MTSKTTFKTGVGEGNPLDAIKSTIMIEYFSKLALKNIIIILSTSEKQSPKVIPGQCLQMTSNDLDTLPVIYGVIKGELESGIPFHGNNDSEA